MMNRRGAFKGVLGMVIGATAAPALAEEKPRWQAEELARLGYIYLGRYHGVDLWLFAKGLGVAIAVYGPEKGENDHEHCLKLFATATAGWRAEAYRRATARGLLERERPSPRGQCRYYETCGRAI